MTKKTVIVSVAPHLQGEEFTKRFDAAVEQRNQADYACFRVLRDLRDSGALDLDCLVAAFKRLGSDQAEAKECAEYHLEEVSDALKKRLDADRVFTNVMRGESNEAGV